MGRGQLRKRDRSGGVVGPQTAGAPSRGLSLQAQLSMKEALGRLRSVVSADDAREFQSTTLQDVYIAARDIERQLAARQCLRNTRRLQPFLNGLEHYSKVVEILCNGIPYLAWIWAPIKLMVQLASDHISSFEKLIAAYSQIADVLPRFDRLSEAFKDNHDFSQIIAVVYTDILEFHENAYKFFRRRGWKFFFSSSWGRFDSKFKTILQNLARHTELVDQEAQSISIVEAKLWRSKAMEENEKRERDSAIFQRQAVMSWLKSNDSLQEDELDAQAERCYSDTCNWIITNPKIISWMERKDDNKTLWLKGKPGSGKTVLCAKTIRFLKLNPQLTVLYYFCNNYRSNEMNSLLAILRSFCCQLIQIQPNLSSYFFDEYIGKGFNPTLQHLSNAIRITLQDFDNVRLVVDGLDEWDSRSIKKIIGDLIVLTSCGAEKGSHKLLISSRDIPQISRALSKKSVISLSDEKMAIDAAIRTYAHASIMDLYDIVQENVDSVEMEDIENKLVRKADGMFLWARLVLMALEDADNLQELRNAIEFFPRELESLYRQILENIKEKVNAHSYEKALRVLSWIAFAKRPLKSYELQYGALIHAANITITSETKPLGNIFDICKPFVEDGLNHTVIFVHSSVKEYLLDMLSGPAITPLVAHHDITFSCVAYLNSSFDLVDPVLCTTNSLARVCEGFHSLQPYANRFWLDHLLDYVKISPNFHPNTHSVLMVQLSKLCKLYYKFSNETKHGGLVTDSLSHLDDERLERLTGWGDIYELAKQVVGDRRALLRRQLGGNKDGPLEDKTVLGRMLQTYHSYVQTLLKSKSLFKTNEEILSRFKLRYGPSAFVCRYQSCKYATMGFASEADLTEHEKGHLPNFVCSISGCEYSILGFRTYTAQRQHMLNYHTTEVTINSPKTLLGSRLDGVHRWTGKGAIQSKSINTGPRVHNQNLKNISVSDENYTFSGPFTTRPQSPRSSITALSRNTQQGNTPSINTEVSSLPNNDPQLINGENKWGYNTGDHLEAPYPHLAELDKQMQTQMLSNMSQDYTQNVTRAQHPYPTEVHPTASQPGTGGSDLNTLKAQYQRAMQNITSAQARGQAIPPIFAQNVRNLQKQIRVIEYQNNVLQQADLINLQAAAAAVSSGQMSQAQFIQYQRSLQAQRHLEQQRAQQIQFRNQQQQRKQQQQQQQQQQQMDISMGMGIGIQEIQGMQGISQEMGNTNMANVHQLQNPQNRQTIGITQQQLQLYDESVPYGIRFHRSESVTAVAHSPDIGNVSDISVDSWGLPSHIEVSRSKTPSLDQQQLSEQNLHRSRLEEDRNWTQMDSGIGPFKNSTSPPSQGDFRLYSPKPDPSIESNEAQQSQQYMRLTDWLSNGPPHIDDGNQAQVPQGGITEAEHFGNLMAQQRAEEKENKKRLLNARAEQDRQTASYRRATHRQASVITLD